jgi:leucyl-tRNA synthetase
MNEEGYWAPYTHQVVWCPECSQVVGQEYNRERKALSSPFQDIKK